MVRLAVFGGLDVGEAGGSGERLAGLQEYAIDHLIITTKI